jgi:hypothetical protein
METKHGFKIMYHKIHFALKNGMIFPLDTIFDKKSLKIHIPQIEE